MKEEDICKLLIRLCKIFESSEDKLKSAISLLQRLGVEGQALSELVARVPRLLTIQRKKFWSHLNRPRIWGSEGIKDFCSCFA
jgi:hypothetical protein